MDKYESLTNDIRAKALPYYTGEVRAALDRAEYESAERLLDDAGSFGLGDDELRELKIALIARRDRPDGMVLLPARAYQIGSRDGADRNPERSYTPAMCYIATKEITVAEYERFVRDSGYDSAEYWDDEGHAFLATLEGARMPLDWEQQLTLSDAPVRGVSVHEARAYARPRDDAGIAPFGGDDETREDLRVEKERWSMDGRSDPSATGRERGMTRSVALLRSSSRTREAATTGQF